MASSLSSVQFRVVEVVVEGEVTYGDAAGAHHSIQICQTVVKLFQYRINCPQNLVNVFSAHTVRLIRYGNRPK